MVKYKNVPFKINKHSDLELLLVHEGKIEMHLDHAVFNASPNDTIVANSNVLHNIIPLTNSIRYDCIIINKDFCNQYGFMIDKNHIQEIIKDPKLFEKVRQIKEITKNKHSPFSMAEITANVLEILLILFRQYQKEIEIEADCESRKMLEKGIEFIHDNFNQPINVEMIASYVGYSKFHFCRKFKEVTGCTVNTYINMRRISFAKKQLRSTNLSVAEIAAESGFNNLAYFSKTFRKYVSQTPKEYQKHNLS